MKKNAVPVVLIVAMLMVVAVAEAQQFEKIYRIGYLTERSANSEKSRFEAFRQELQRLGYTEGKNLVIELRRAPTGQKKILRDMAAELVRLNVNVIVASGGGSTQAAKDVTTTIPIVFTVSADPVGSGLVASLARPGGNVTGLSDLHSALVAKRLELLKEVVPTATSVGVLLNPRWPTHSRQLKDIEAAAPTVGIKVVPLPVTGADDIKRAFTAFGKKGLAGLLVLGDPLLGNHRKLIADFALEHRVPTISTNGRSVLAGGLMSYGSSHYDLWARAASYVDKILKGRKPAELPVEQPMRFELVINLKTAKMMGLTIPRDVRVRANQVIE